MTQAEAEFTRQMRVKFNNLPKAKKDEIAWYQVRGMDAYATKLLMDAIGLVVIEKPNEEKHDATTTIPGLAQTD